eukprot:CAMPEP_0204914766 /NCGR_PEP_ID=MMETSP1397-20131031/12655_1 /ASSEMBLY_ACC=CAM_ASM_000891 /TAXON_ID=49980 /ORGANISM="Climacostomum Climacostomum virens, Strain Stock W-24" /LENGTH=201 /DNA_ID=CAMNT_0052086477 /DNA_START=147 /DNA_END=749 /DNA_ORIENTATION=+
MGDLALLFEQFKDPSRRELLADDEGCLDFSDEADDLKVNTPKQTYNTLTFPRKPLDYRRNFLSGLQARNIEDGLRPLATRSASSEERKTPIMLHCELCQYEVSEKETSKLNCKHRFCTPCLEAYLKSLVTSNKVRETDFVCPMPTCRASIASHLIESNLSSELSNQLNCLALKNSDSTSEKYVECPLCKRGGGLVQKTDKW